VHRQSGSPPHCGTPTYLFIDLQCVVRDESVSSPEFLRPCKLRCDRQSYTWSLGWTSSPVTSSSLEYTPVFDKDPLRRCKLKCNTAQRRQKDGKNILRVEHLATQEGAKSQCGWSLFDPYLNYHKLTNVLELIFRLF